VFREEDIAGQCPSHILTRVAVGQVYQRRRRYVDSLDFSRLRSGGHAQDQQDGQQNSHLSLRFSTILAINNTLRPPFQLQRNFTTRNDKK
jgi:hypothetical protein